MLQNKFLLKVANDYVWNQAAFVDFLIANQGKSIIVDTSEEGVDLNATGVYQLLDQFGYHDTLVITNNLLESHVNNRIKHKNPFKYFNLSSKDYSKYHYWSEKKTFACLYNRPLWHRIGIAAEMQCNYPAQTTINMRSDPADVDQRTLFELQQLFEHAPGSVVKFAQVQDSWPCQIEQVDTYTVGNTTNGHTDQLAHFYPDFLIDIVAETWTQGNCFFPTEKTVRPMLLKKPMIVMGPKNYFEYLRQMGFQTFYHFWDENYDGFGNGDRYSKILTLIDSIAKLSTQQLHNMYTEMQYVLDHNYNLLVGGKFLKNIQFIND